MSNRTTAINALSEAVDFDTDYVHSAIVVDETDEGGLYLLVIRSIEDGEDLWLDERGFVVREDGTGTFTKNGIKRRLGGRIADALVRAYGRTCTDLNVDPDERGSSLLLDGREGIEGDMSESAEDVLTTPLSELQEDDESEDEVVDYSDTSVEQTTSGPTVTCEQCGTTIPKDEAVNFGGGTLDVWVCEGGCPADE